MDSEPLAHPLFPARTPDDDPPVVESIHVTRTPDGTHYRAFSPEELTSTEQLYEWFGGGHYTLIARDGRGISARATVRLSGRPKPLNPDFEDEGKQTVAATSPTIAPGGEMLVAMIGMMQQSQNTMTQMMMQQSKGQSEMVVAMMQAQKADSAQQMQLLAQQQQQATAAQAQLISVLAERHAPPENQLDIFMRGMDFAAANGGADESSEVESLVESLAPLVAGFMQQQQGGKNE